MGEAQTKKRWFCWLRLHWLVDHGTTYDPLKDCGRCKSCGYEFSFWPKPKRRNLQKKPAGGEDA